jgi:hypothetical protein
MIEERKDNQLSTKDIANASNARREEAEAAARAEANARRNSAPSPATALAEHHDAESHDALFPTAEVEALRTRWEAIQAGFVDEPRNAVTEADALVAQTVTRLAEVFAGEKTTLEKQWDHGNNISTEDLRVALRRYRAFFDRLLTV